MSDNSGPREGITVHVCKTTKINILSKAVVIIIVGVSFGHFYARSMSGKVEKSNSISVEKCAREACLDEVLEYKKILSSDSDIPYDNPLVPALVFTISVLFMAGTYELFALLISFMLKKVLK